MFTEVSIKQQSLPKRSLLKKKNQKANVNFGIEYPFKRALKI